VTDAPLAAVVMAGGLGTRMRSALPKHFHPILGRRMVDWILETGREAGAAPLVVVASPSTRGEFADSGVEVAVQETPLGTGDAVRAARGALEASAGDVLVLSGDTPLLTAQLLRDLVETHHRAGADATILSSEPADPRLYGRIVRGADGSVLKVVEGTDANEKELKIREVNSSIYVFRASALWPALAKLEPKNVQGELYLTDAIEIITAGGGTARPDQRGAHARRGHDRRPDDDLDRAHRRDRPRRDDRAVHIPARLHEGGDRRADRGQHGGDRRSHRP
jgi:bifunctional UDP-N-acetylglucosamine pyrophosphorylase/glucosamine-1-phosphate N-acetyltransferase